MFGTYRGYNENVITELTDIHVIYRFPEAFLEELPRLPSNRGIKFETELLLGTVPISKVPDWIVPAVLMELK